MIGIALVMAALVPALASAAAFQRVGPAPGGDDLAVIKGVPHVAYATSDGIRVSRLATGNVWVQVGGAIRHASGRAVGPPSLTGDANGVPWVAWTERDSSGIPQARVARFTGGSWREVVGGARPINQGDPRQGPTGAYEPRIAFFAGRPYVAYAQDNPSELILDVARLSADGKRWEHVHPGFVPRAHRQRLAASGGHLYLASEDGLGPGPRVFRLNDARTGWVDAGVSTDLYQLVGDIADVGGSPVFGYSATNAFGDQTTQLLAQAGTSGGNWSQLDTAAATADADSFIDPQGVAGDGAVPYISGLRGGELIVSRFVDGSWEPLDSPSASATSALLKPGLTGGVWLLFGESSGGTTTYYLDTLGATLPANGGPAPGPPEPTPSGHCVKTINGTAAADRLTGTRLGDSLFGFAGNDTLIAYAGSDCLYGGGGNDYLSGGKGNDFFSGGSGNDREYGGAGDDGLDGGAGNDVIRGGRGEDAITAGSGRDWIDVTQQGADLVDCGPGRDTVVITPIDGYRNCERVIIRR